MVGLNHHLTTFLVAAGTITTMTNAMPFSESKSFTSLHSLQSRDGLSSATSSTDIAALDAPQTQERRQQVLELPKAALANSAGSSSKVRSRKRFADTDPTNPMIRVAMRLLGSRSILSARSAPRKLTISMNTLRRKAIAVDAAASPGAATSVGAVDGIAASVAASEDSAASAASLDQPPLDEYFDTIFDKREDDQVLSERGRHPKYNKVVVKGNNDRVRLHGAAKHAKIIVKGNHDRVNINNGHHGHRGNHGHRGHHGKHGKHGKHGHHRHHGREEEVEVDEGVERREDSDGEEVYRVMGDEKLNARADVDDEDLGSPSLAARSPRSDRHRHRHHHHHHGHHRHGHYWDDRSVEDASLDPTGEDFFGAGEILQARTPHHQPRSIEDKVIGDTDSLEAHLEDRSPEMHLEAHLEGRSPHRGHRHRKHHGKDKTLVIKGDNKTVDLRRRETEGARGRVDIMSPNSEGGDGTRIASLCMGDDLVLNACDEGEPVPIYLLPIDSVSGAASDPSASDTTPAKQVILQIPVYNAVTAKEEKYCATFDPRPAEPAPLTAVECATDPTQRAQEHQSQIFEYDSGTGVVKPMWSSEEKGQSASAEDKGMDATGTDTISRNPAPSMDPPTSMEAGTAGVTSVDPEVLRREDPPSSNSPSSTSPDAATDSSTPYQAQNVTLLFVPDDPVIKAAPKPTTSAGTEVPTTVAETTTSTDLKTTPTPTPTPAPTTTESPVVAGALQTGANTAMVDHPAAFVDPSRVQAPAALNVIQVPAGGSPNFARSNRGGVDAQGVAESLAAERKAMYAARTAAGLESKPTGTAMGVESYPAVWEQPQPTRRAQRPAEPTGTVGPAEELDDEGDALPEDQDPSEESDDVDEAAEPTRAIEARAPSMTSVSTEPYNWKFQRDMD